MYNSVTWWCSSTFLYLNHISFYFCITVAMWSSHSEACVNKSYKTILARNHKKLQSTHGLVKQQAAVIRRRRWWLTWSRNSTDTLISIYPPTPTTMQVQLDRKHNLMHHSTLIMHRRWRWRHAAVGVTVYRLGRERDALLLRPLVRPLWYAVLLVVPTPDLQAPLRLPAEVVVGVREVLQPRQLANALRYVAGEVVVRHVQLLQLPHLPDAVRQRPHEAVEAHVEHRQILQLPDVLRDARRDARVQQYQLV